MKNEKAIGKILHETYSILQYSDLQIILFDDKDAADLGLTPNISTNLIGEGKSGFNPFYYQPPNTDDNSFNNTAVAEEIKELPDTDNTSPD